MPQSAEFEVDERGHWNASAISNQLTRGDRPSHGSSKTDDFGAAFVSVVPVFDMAFFGGAFAESVREFSRDHDDAHVRLEVVTLTGERLDALELSAVETGIRLSSRDERLVFMPYAQVAFVEVAILKDHRVPGFQLSVGSD